jgi:hypothetical protein
MNTTIQTAIRIRPRVQYESYESDILTYDNESVKLSDGDLSFESSYGRVFGPETPQGEVYSFLSPMVSSSQFGIDTIIIAHGQTGTGKTHTILGTYDYPGCLPRTITQLLRILSAEFAISLSILEIYNEALFDLLNDDKKETNLCIREGKKNGVYVKELTEYVIERPEDTFKIVQKADYNRHTRNTCMCQSYKYAYIIYQVNVEHKMPNSLGKIFKSKISFIDSAGSERLQKNAAYGEHLRLVASINKSMATARNVIIQLANKASGHIRYRDSKLTYLLKDSFQRNCNICMIGTVCSSAYASETTLATLRFLNITRIDSRIAELYELSVSDSKMINKDLQRNVNHVMDNIKTNKGAANVDEMLRRIKEENESLIKEVDGANIYRAVEENKEVKEKLKTFLKINDNCFGVVEENKEVEKQDYSLEITICELKKVRKMQQLKDKRMQTLRQIKKYEKINAKEIIDKYECSNLISREEGEIMQEIKSAKKEYNLLKKSKPQEIL